jgi:putative FmdB family regulatory protein
MPIYEYACQECHHKFETLVRSGDEPACPECQSHALEKLLSVFATTSTEAAPAMPNPCGSCGNPGGPGSCAFANA